jgi:acetyl-CoA acetyltransferase
VSGAYVVGGSMIKMGKHRDSTYTGLAAPAALGALHDAGITSSDVQAVYCGHAFGGMLTGQRILSQLGIGGIPVTNIDNACSGGATAVHQAVRAVEHGEIDVALVIGVDKLTQFGGGTLPLVLEDVEVQQGIVMPAVYAMRAQRFLYERDATIEDLALVSVKARRHGARNPYAQFQKEVTLEEVLASRPIADPLTLLQCCPTGDGAAAVVVMSESARRKHDGRGMKSVASVLHSGQFQAGFRDMLRPEISYDSAKDAYELAGIEPKDLDLIELHDAFSIAELVYYEALGLCEPGNATKLLRDGETTYGGSVVVNPSGGLLSKGHPVGASGVAQVVEALWHLSERAGRRQVSDAKLALTHVTGGGIAGLDHGACTINIFEATA